MTNYILRMQGGLPLGRSWSCGIKCTSSASLATVASTWDAAWTTLWTTTTNGLKNFYKAEVTTIQDVVYACNAQWRTTAKLVTPNAQVGIDANNTVDNNASVMMTFSGAADTPSDRGRMFLPPPANDTFTADVWTAGFLNSLKLVFDPFFTTLNGLAGYQQVTFNKHTNKIGDPPFTNHVITNYAIGNKPAVQRRRTRKTRPTNSVTGVV